MSLFFSLLLVFIFSFLFLSFWKKDFYFWEWVALALSLGLGIITLIMFYLGILKIPLKPVNINLALVFLILLLTLILWVRKTPFRQALPHFKFPKLSILEVILFLSLLFLVSWSFLQTINWPPYEWDTLSLYDFRAQRFAQTHSLAQEALTREVDQPNFAIYNYSYPFFTSLLHTLAYINGVLNPQFFYSIFYFSTLLLFYFFLRRLGSRTSALFFTLVLGTSWTFLYLSTIAYTNLPFAFYFSFSTLYLLRWLSAKKDSYLLISVLFLGLSTWVRSAESFWVVNLLIIILVLLKQKRLFALLGNLALFFFIRQGWVFYREQILNLVPGAHLPPYHFILDTTKIIPSLTRLFEVISKDEKGFLVLFLLTCLLGGQKNLKNLDTLFLILFYLFSFWGGAYMLSVSDPLWLTRVTSAERVAIFLLPLILYFTYKLFFAKNGKNAFR